MKHRKRIQLRTNGMYYLGGIILFSGMLLWGLTQDTPPPRSFSYSVLSVACLCIFVGSIFVIKYKEAPGTFNRPDLKGGFAVFIGILSAIISGGGLIVAMYEVINSFLGK